MVDFVATIQQETVKFSGVIKNNSSRPMFQDANSFEKLLKQRESIYYEADFVVKTDYKTPEKIASEISLLIE